jgi:hypothetical protein
MGSCGLLPKTVKASQSIVRVKPESMEPIELLQWALWLTPPCYPSCYQGGGHSGPPQLIGMRRGPALSPGDGRTCCSEQGSIRSVFASL